MPRTMILNIELQPDQKERLRRLAAGWNIYESKDSSVWIPYLKEAEIVAGWNRHAEQQCLEEDASVKWVHTWAAGVDRMPLEQFSHRDIYLTNSSGVHGNPISETIFAMMLAFTRKLHLYLKLQQTKKWGIRDNPLEMHGKTVGILGVGAIGLETARLAKAFNMKVLGMRRTGGTEPDVDRMFVPAELDSLLPECDYIVNTLPLTSDTYHMIGEEQFALMKTSAVYINIGRGKTTDTAALLEALQTGRIAGAGLDVFEEEPLPADHPLWDVENVILTHHTSGMTERYNERAANIFLDNLETYLQGKPPQLNLVNYTAGY